MADGLRTKQLSLDTYVLMDIAANYEFAIGFKDAFQGLGYTLHVVPSVLVELNYLSKYGNEIQQQRASIALAKLTEWKITPYFLTDLQKKYRQNFVTFAERRELMPPAEKNDIQILADTAIAEIPLLVTSDQILADVDRTLLHLICSDSGLAHVSVAHVRELWRAMRRFR